MSFFKFMDNALKDIYKFKNYSSYIEHSWRFMKILLHIDKENHSQLIFFGYIYIYM